MTLVGVEEGANFLAFKLPEKVGPEAAQELLGEVKALLLMPSRLYVLDFSKVKSLDVVTHKAFALFHRALKKTGSSVFTIGMEPTLRGEIESNGLDGVFTWKNDMNEALVAAGLKVSGLDMDFVNPFVQAVKSTLEIQASTPVKLGEIRMKQENETFVTDIAGVISLASRKYNGSLALCFPSAVFLEIYSNMLGEKQATITREMEDAAGELLNMIFGVAKAHLNNTTDADIQRAIPTVVRGEQLRVHHLSRGSVLVVQCTTGAGEFHFEMSLEAAP